MSDFDTRVDKLESLTQIARAEQVTIHQYASTAPGRTRIVVLPPFRPRLYDIVGRAEPIARIVAALQSGQRILALVHLPGVGKTTLAAELARNATLAERYPDGILWAHLGLDPDLRGQLRKWAYALGISEARMKDFDALEQWQEAVSQAIGERRMLLVIDDVWDATAGEHFLLGGEGCAYLVTTRYPGVAASLAQEWYELRTLTEKEGVALLRHLAPEAVSAEPDAASRLVAQVDGLPLALVLMGHYLRQQGKFKQQGRIRAALETLRDVDTLYQLSQPPEYPSDTPRSLATVIETSYRDLGRAANAYDGDTLREAMKALSVLRPDPARFTRELAEQLTGLRGGGLHELCDAGLVDALQLDAPRPDDPSGGERYTLHRTIVEYIYRKLAPDQAKALHLRVAEFYRHTLKALDEHYQSSPTDYARWYRYEDLDWQDCKDNWLFHMARAGEYEAVAFAFLIAWFDAFWWWGCFLEFGFCDQLLREWRQRASRAESESGLRLLAEFKDAYPKETEDRSGGDWHKVAEVLHEVRRRAHLDGDPEALVTAEQRHLRGLTALFLAESRRFGARDAVAAEALYREALALFERNEDRWDVGWTLYHLADFLCECERHDEAWTTSQRAQDQAVDEDDPELRALVACVQAAVAIGRHDEATACAQLHAAVLQAYRFQVEPQAPDPYTIRFFPQVAQRVAAMILRLHAGKCAEDCGFALRIATRLRDAWAPAKPAAYPDAALADMLVSCTRDAARALAAALFPEAITADDLGDDERIGRYADRVRNTLTRITTIAP